MQISAAGFQLQSFQPQMVLTVTCERFSEVWVCSVTQVLEFVLLMCECFVPFFRIIPPCDPTADDRLYHICITAISVSPLSCWINVTHYNVLSFTVICSLGVWYHTMLSGVCKVWLSKSVLFNPRSFLSIISRISQKVANRFEQNLVERWAMVQGTNDGVLMQIQAWTQATERLEEGLQNRAFLNVFPSH